MDLKRTIPTKETRSPEQLYEHYTIEKALAQRLRQATAQERTTLYATLYDELFLKVPHHSQLTRKQQFDASSGIIQQRLALLTPYLRASSQYLEIGPGDCYFALEVAKKVAQVYAVDVSEAIIQRDALPENFHLTLSDGTSIPVAPNSIDVAYSYQVMEHLHPEDAIAQLKNIQTALKPGGVYLCITPSRLTGPHDISKYFDEVATGFHLKEYVVSELAQLFLRSGFRRVSLCKQYRHRNILIPLNPVVLSLFYLCETILETLPSPLRHTIAEASFLFRSITMIGQK
jgi:SAM-dependent methyltransferase